MKDVVKRVKTHIKLKKGKDKYQSMLGYKTKKWSDQYEIQGNSYSWGDRELVIMVSHMDAASR